MQQIIIWSENVCGYVCIHNFISTYRELRNNAGVHMIHVQYLLINYGPVRIFEMSWVIICWGNDLSSVRQQTKSWVNWNKRK